MSDLVIDIVVFKWKVEFVGDRNGKVSLRLSCLKSQVFKMYYIYILSF